MNKIAFVRRWQSEGHNIRWSRPSTKAWKVQYAERLKVQKHWSEGKPNVMTLSAHTGTVTSLRYDDTRLISASGLPFPPKHVTMPSLSI
jgi:hypothetical protein